MHSWVQMDVSYRNHMELKCCQTSLSALVWFCLGVSFGQSLIYACLAWCMLILHKLIMVLLQPRPPNEWVQLSLCLLCLTNCILWGDCEAVWWRKTQRHDPHVILRDKKHERYCISQLSCSNGSSGGQGVSQGTVLLLCADSVGWMFQQQWAGRKQGDPERSHT